MIITPMCALNGRKSRCGNKIIRPATRWSLAGYGAPIRRLIGKRLSVPVGVSAEVRRLTSTGFDTLLTAIIADDFAIYLGSRAAIETRLERSSAIAQFRFRRIFLSIRQPFFSVYRHGHLLGDPKRIGLRGKPPIALFQHSTRIGSPFMVFSARRSSSLSDLLHPQAQITIGCDAPLRRCVRNSSKPVAMFDHPFVSPSARSCCRDC